MSPPYKVDLSGKTALVTGAGQGIGKVYAQALAKAKGRVVVSDIDLAHAEGVAASIVSEGGTATAIRLDVTDEAEVAEAAGRIESEFGGCDILINNAALYTTLSRGLFDAIPPEEWRRTMDVNITGSYLCARAVLPHMKTAGWGRIVNISSGTVASGRPSYLHYVTSKAAIIGMTRSMAREIGEFGINVNCIMPGLIDTEIKDVQPEAVWDGAIARQIIKRRGQPEDLLGTLLFLCSEGSDYITGQTIAVDGGAVHL